MYVWYCVLVDSRPLIVLHHQITGLESAVRSVENATSLIHKKKSMQIQKKASHLLPKSYPVNDTALDVSAHPIAKKGVSINEHDLSKKAAASQKYLEKVKYLEAEMERVRGGVKLLGRSVERLNEAIVFDSRCFGGVYDAVSHVLGSCFEMSPQVKNHEYSSVQMQSLDDSGHDSESVRRGGSEDNENNDEDATINEVRSSSTGLL